MGDFSRDTFNRLKHYVSVRLQQGVPVLDADWNELQDIRKFELEAFVKWFVGNGVPYGNDGFAISSTAAADDFSIADGHCLVEGWDAVNDWAEQHGDVLLQYSSQRDHRNADLVSWGLADLPELTPTSPRTDTVYLDVWERQVDSSEDVHIINPDIGIETCVRIKREWVVRVSEGTAALPAARTGHVFYPLATINWKKDPDPSVPAVIDSITDLRRTGVTSPSRNDIQQIVTDAYGDSYTLDGDGLPNLKLSLREAINANLTGRLPGTAPQVLPGDNVGPPSVCEDANGGIWAFWAPAVGLIAQYDIWYHRYDRVGGAWEGPLPLTSAQGSDDLPRALGDSAGGVWVFWSSARLGAKNIWYNRYDESNGWEAEDTQLTFETNDVGIMHFVFEDNAGVIWAFWPAERVDGRTIWYKCYDLKNDSWNPEGEQQLPTNGSAENNPFAFVDSAGTIWILWSTSRISINYSNIVCLRFDGELWTDEFWVTTETAKDERPFAVEDGWGNILVFWTRDSGQIWCRRHNRHLNQWDDETLLTAEFAFAYRHFAIRGTRGDVWLFWETFLEAEKAIYPLNIIYCKRYSAETGWSQATQVSTDIGQSYRLAALVDQERDLWLFWNTTSPDGCWYRKLITEI